MEETISISRSEKLPVALDYRQLREYALKFAQQFSGAIWTDYNQHDPGVTILEYICFALTDLGYRADFDIEEILNATTGEEEPPEHSLFPPHKILPAHPQTIADYRKLIIDHVAGVNNAWLIPIPDHNNYDGLYTVQLQLGEDYGPSTHLAVKDEVRKVLMAHRNLCEDVDDIQILQHMPITLRAKINLEIDALGEAVIARVLAALEAFLTPNIETKSLEELLQEGTGINDAFDGPLPKYGFIPSDSLSPLLSVIYVSQLQEVISKVEGVRSVDHTEVSINGIVAQQDEIALPANTYAVLSEEMKTGRKGRSHFQLLRSGVGVPVDLQQVQQQYKVLIVRRQKKFALELDLQKPQKVVSKKLTDIADYKSFQRLFPAAYGIGPYGLPGDADNKRKAQAKQLRAYLVIFEQFLANYLMQLAHLRELFSIEEKYVHAPSYYGQVPLDVPDLLTVLRRPRQLVNPDLEAIKDGEEYGAAAPRTDFDRLLQQFDDSAERRSRFLDHLLARFGEVFYSDLLRKIWIGEGLSEDEISQELLSAKANYLRSYPLLSQERGKGFDYTQNSWHETKEPKKEEEEKEEAELEPTNVSGLEKRLYRYLSFGQYGNHPLTNFALDDFDALKGFSVQEGAKKKPKGGAGKTRLSLRELLRYGMNRENYSVIKNKSGLFGAYFHRTSNAKPQLVFLHEERDQCRKVIRTLMDWLRKIDSSSSGFFMIEHLLLRPSTSLGRRLVFDVSKSGVKHTFRSLEYHAAEQVRYLSNVLMVTASEPKNYVRLQNNGDTYLLLKLNDHPILITDNPLTPEELAGDPVKIITDFLNNLKVGGSTQIDDWIELTPEEDYAKQVGREYFSHRLSIVLPDWPRRFQMTDFRKFFQFLVQTSIPAHLKVDIHWFSIGKFKQFEDLYRQWLQEKSREEVITRKLDQLSLGILNVLLAKDKKHEVLQAFVEKKKSADEDLREKQRAVVGAVGFAVLEETDLRIFVGIDATIELLLKHHNIESWSQLHVIAPQRLAEFLRAANLRSREEMIDAWQRQATLAERGAWKELIALQRELEELKEETDQPKIIRYLEEHFGGSPTA